VLQLHNPHGSDLPGILKYREDKVCYGCHADAEAGFVKKTIHKPILLGNCSPCHAAHGAEEKSSSGKPVPPSAAGATGT